MNRPSLKSIRPFLLLMCTVMCTLICTVESLHAQPIFRSEFVPYTLRRDSDSLQRSEATRRIDFRPTTTRVLDSPVPHISVTQLLDIPFEWAVGRVFMHLENVGMAYNLRINNRVVSHNDDPFTPAEYDITEFLRQGANIISVELLSPTEPDLQEGVELSQAPKRNRFSNSYIYPQYNRRVVDYDAVIRPDTSGRFARLNIVAVVENRHNFEERIDVGFDIYDPAGKLVDYSVRPVMVEGGGRDTVRFTAPIYNSDQYRWSPSNPALYRVTLLTKSDGVVRSYLPRKVAYVDYSYGEAGEFFNFGERDTLRSVSYNALRSREEAAMDMERLKGAGYNTLRPTYPQPMWYYDLAAELGLYIVEQVNINAPSKSDIRSVGGTVSNDPALLERFLRRGKASYFRTRGNSSIVGYSLGSDSGNGYNMYKLYEMMKGLEGLEGERPIIYEGARGEWNSDKLNILDIK